MLSRLNHVAIAVPDLEQAASQYRSLGAVVSDPRDLAEHGVTVVFVELANTKIELLYPLGEQSSIHAFLAKNPAGGIHHLCFEVPSIDDAATTIGEMGVRILGDGTAKIGAHGKPVLFAHPKDFQGALIEFEQA